MQSLLRGFYALGVFFTAISIFYAAPAVAQVSRTYVSASGNDASLICTLSAPCRTFSSAHSKTIPSGEIICLDNTGYGAVTITKSITIDCRKTSASIVGLSGTAVTINAVGVDVTLRGLILNGGAFDDSGSGLTFGVQFLQGNSLKIV